MKLLNVTKSALAVFALLSGSIASAAPINIAELASSNGPGFQHNNIHDATTNNGTNGARIGWFTLGNLGGSYDPANGDFIVNIDIYQNKNLTNMLGTAVGTGNLTLAEFNGFDGGTIGSIFWDFDDGLNTDGLDDVTTTFFDIDYNSVSSQGYVPNSQQGNALTLWGSGATSTGLFPLVGIDMVVILETNPVPVPAAAWLFGSGLIALVGLTRRKTSQL